MTMLIDNVTLIDGTGADARPRQSVVIDGERIAWVGPADGVDRAQSHDLTIDGTGKYLTPGLIDGHIHVCWNGYESVLQLVRQNDRDRLAIDAVVSLSKILHHGTTSVRDIGGHDYLEMSLRRAVNAGVIPGPRMKVSGKLIAMTGGHAYFIAREADGPDEMRKAAREQLKRGADVIKLMATGGAATPGMDVHAPHLTVEEMKAAADEAHKLGKRAAAHAHGVGGIKNCVLAGLDAIEHGTYLYMDPDTARMMADKGTYLVLTLAVGQPRPGQKLSAESEDFLRRASPGKEALRKTIPLAVELGVPIASGSDAGGNEFGPHGDSMAIELEYLVDYGFTPLEALTIVTRNNARLMDMEREIGTVETGKYADLLLLRDNPLTNISHIRAIDYVLKGGDIVRQP